MKKDSFAFGFAVIIVLIAFIITITTYAPSTGSSEPTGIAKKAVTLEIKFSNYSNLVMFLEGSSYPWVYYSTLNDGKVYESRPSMPEGETVYIYCVNKVMDIYDENYTIKRMMPNAIINITINSKEVVDCYGGSCLERNVMKIDLDCNKEVNER